MISKRKLKFYTLAFFKRDFKASITVFFVALPLCLGVSLASGAPLSSGIIAGIVGGMVVTLFSKSELSVSGPAAGLTGICAAAIMDLGSLEVFFLAVAIAGLLQVLLGILKLGGFTHFIPSAVIKGMLTAIGILLISKQIPLLIGYDQADFWTKELFNIITFDNAFMHIQNIYDHTSAGPVLIAMVGMITVGLWKKYFSARFPAMPGSFVIVLLGAVMAFIFSRFVPYFELSASQFVQMPEKLFSEYSLPDFSMLMKNHDILKVAVTICFVATLETLLSIEAIDKFDPYNRITPQNRELLAQGTGNFFSGLLGGLPITAVIVRSAANAEAGARTRLSAFFHGVWLLLLATLAAGLVNYIPYCILAVILVRTGYNLAKPEMILAVYRQGREQFVPFIVTVVAILLTDLLIGVCIGVAYAGYFILKNTYKAGYTLDKRSEGHTTHYLFRLAINVSYLNKKKLKDELEKIPQYAIVDIDGSHSVYIDHDILEVISEFKSKARHKHISLNLKGVKEVGVLSAH